MSQLEPKPAKSKKIDRLLLRTLILMMKGHRSKKDEKRPKYNS